MVSFIFESREKERLANREVEANKERLFIMWLLRERCGRDKTEITKINGYIHLKEKEREMERDILVIKRIMI